MTNLKTVDFNKELLPNRDFYFLRHGETEFNREGRFQGRTDVSLNETGLRQAREATAKLAMSKIDRIVSSPAQRVQQTVNRYAEAQGIPVHLDDHLMEFYVGSFEGQRVAEIREAHELDPHDSLFSVLPADADNWQEFVPRVCGTVRRWTDKHPDDTLLFAAHGLVYRALALSLTGNESASRNAEPLHFSRKGSGWTISRL